MPAENCQDLVFENVQARMRTSLLMNTGFVIGTGDLSESALGWCTYNGDHMSMYNPNGSIPKTLVKFLVALGGAQRVRGRGTAHAARHRRHRDLAGAAAAGATGKVAQSDRERHRPLRAARLLPVPLPALRRAAGEDPVPGGHARLRVRPTRRDEVRRWLQVFVRRFFANQFKRSCLPDGPKVGSISLSPRGDWRMPSDAQARAWLDCLEE